MALADTRLFCFRAALCVAALLFAGVNAYAARPMITDDANIVDAQSCQLESWVKAASGNLERWAIPGCNLAWDTEFSLGGSAQQASTVGATQLWLLQAKKRWRKLEVHSWGFSTTLGRTSERPGRSQQRELEPLPPGAAQDTYLNVPITWAVASDRFIHLNLGWIHHERLRVSHGTWGLGGEVGLGPRSFAIGEVFGETGLPAKTQLGLRYWISPQKLQMDTTYGQALRGGKEERWISIGFRWLSDPLW
jgi:hypothetical protein